MILLNKSLPTSFLISKRRRRK